MCNFVVFPAPSCQLTVSSDRFDIRFRWDSSDMILKVSWSVTCDTVHIIIRWKHWNFTSAIQGLYLYNSSIGHYRVLMESHTLWVKCNHQHAAAMARVPEIVFCYVLLQLQPLTALWQRCGYHDAQIHSMLCGLFSTYLEHFCYLLELFVIDSWSSWMVLRCWFGFVMDAELMSCPRIHSQISR